MLFVDAPFWTIDTEQNSVYTAEVNLHYSTQRVKCAEGLLMQRRLGTIQIVAELINRKGGEIRPFLFSFGMLYY